MVEFRKLISFGKTSYVLSLPKKWVLKNNLKKGNLIAVSEKDNGLMLSPNPDTQEKQIEKKSLVIDDLGIMTARYIHALFKRGVDEIDVSFNNPELIEDVQRALGKESVGYEIIDQKQNLCIIKNISSGLEGFDQLLRRTFLLLISMANESLEAIKNKQYNSLKNISLLEESNNRFTTSCRRILNKSGYKNTKLGPLYYIVEDIENIADYYKYLCNYIYDHKNGNIKISKEILTYFQEVNEMIRLFYETYYKFDKEKIVQIGASRKNLVWRLHKVFENKKSSKFDIVIAHNLLVISQKVFCFIGPFLVNAL